MCSFYQSEWLALMTRGMNEDPTASKFFQRVVMGNGARHCYLPFKAAERDLPLQRFRERTAANH